MKPVREIIFFGNYFSDFFEGQTDKVKDKIDYVLFVLAHVNQIPEKFLKHLSGHKDLYELRVSYGGSIFRIFCFFDKGNLVVLLNGYQKKSTKTSKNEIDRANRLMIEYYNQYKNGKAYYT